MFRSRFVRHLAPGAIGLVSALAGAGGTAILAHAASGTVNCAGLQAALDASANGDVITLQDDHLCAGAFHPKVDTQVTLQGGDANQGFDGTTAAPLPSIQGSSVKSSTFRNLTFVHGGGSGAGGGGALYIFNDSTPQLIDLRFFSNTPGVSGGALSIQSQSTSGTILLQGCTFGSATDPSKANTSPSDGGAIYIAALTNVTLSTNVIAGNSSKATGGGAFINLDPGGPGATLTLTNNQFIGNTAGENGGGLAVQTRDPVVSLISGNQFRANRLTTADNRTGLNHLGGGLFMGYPPNLLMQTPTSATQSQNVFDANVIEALGTGLTPLAAGGHAVSAFDYGGGGEWVSDVQVVSTRDRFTNNTVAASPATSGVPEAGGLGIASKHRSTNFVGRNLVAAGNTVGAGGNGGGIYVGVLAAIGSTLSLLDSTVAGNTIGAGGSYPAISGDPEDALDMKNTIAAANTGAVVQVGGFGTMAATYTDTCLAGGATMTGAANFCADPRLKHPGPGFADVHETSASPTINVGLNTLVPAAITADYEGDPRIAQAVVDVGADEFEAPAAGQQPVTLPKAGYTTVQPNHLVTALLLLVALALGVPFGRSLRGDRRTP